MKSRHRAIIRALRESGFGDLLEDPEFIEMLNNAQRDDILRGMDPRFAAGFLAATLIISAAAEERRASEFPSESN